MNNPTALGMMFMATGLACLSRVWDKTGWSLNIFMGIVAGVCAFQFIMSLFWLDKNGVNARKS